jgi:hypothetical protein
MTAPLIAPVADDTDDYDLIHIYCRPCSPTVALCGWVDESDDWLDDEESDRDCVVCVDLDRLPCPWCGA